MWRQVSEYMRQRATLRPSHFNRWGIIALIAGLCISGFTLLNTCRSDRVEVNPNDPRSPKFAYRMHELALLQMSADDILNLEKKKQYGAIYDGYASPDFQKSVSRRRFLIMANCVETYLGGLQEFDTNDLGFTRQLLPTQKHPFDILTRKIQRERGKVDEQLVFIPSGLNFKLNGLYWISKDKGFLQCIAASPQIEANTAPMPQTPPGEQTATENATASPEPTTPTEQQAPIPADGEPQEQATPDAEPATQPVTAGGPENSKPRPAGAGAVLDLRPEPEAEKPPTPALDQNKQGHARQGGVAVPLEPGEPATASH